MCWHWITCRSPSMLVLRSVSRQAIALSTVHCRTPVAVSSAPWGFNLVRPVCSAAAFCRSLGAHHDPHVSALLRQVLLHIRRAAAAATPMLRLGLVSDTHGVFDPALAAHFAGVDHILHAGDVGSHGGATAILNKLGELGPAVSAVQGNVDDDAEAQATLPLTLVLELGGWKVLLAHILAAATTAAAVEQHQPNIVVTGHSHKFAVDEVEDGVGGSRLLVNPGSAGPARFRLGRSAALLTLPDRGACACC